MAQPDMHIFFKYVLGQANYRSSVSHYVGVPPPLLLIDTKPHPNLQSTQELSYCEQAVISNEGY